MQILTSTYQQIVDLFRSMTPGARITSGLLLAGVLVSLIYLFRLQETADREMLFGGAEFNQTDIQTMVTAFSNKDLGGWKIVGDRIAIPPGQKAEYLAALGDQQALPANAHSAFDEALKSDTWTTTRDLRERRLKVAKQKLISMVVARLKDFEDAVVTFDEEEPHGLLGKPEKRAIAAIKMRGNRELTPQQIRSVRNTVAGFIGGLHRRNITVTDINSGKAHIAINEDGSPAAGEDPYATRKIMYEQDTKTKIMTALSNIPRVQVGVNVELTKELRHQKQSLKYDKDGFFYESEEESLQKNDAQKQRGGRVGAAPNGVGPNTQAQVAEGETETSTTEETKSRQRGVTGNQVVTVDHTGLTPEIVTAAIQVPSNYFVDVWRQRNPDAAQTPPTLNDPALLAIRDEVIQRIEKTVAVLLPPKPPGEDRYQPVTVTVYDEIPHAPLPKPGLMEDVFGWLSANWTSVGMLMLGGVSLFMLRGMVKQDPAAAQPPPQTLSAAADSQEDEDEEDDESQAGHDGRDNAGKPLRRFGNSGSEIQTELAEMVRENPDAAANVLRGWISEAA